MTPAARLQAAIDILDLVLEAVRGNGAPADRIVADWFRTRRFAGSGDRRAVRDLLFRAIRAFDSPPETGRAAFIGLAQADDDLAALFTGEGFAPPQIVAGESAAVDTGYPPWLSDAFSPLLVGDERDALRGRAPLDLRANALKATREVLLADLPDAVPIVGTRDGLRLETPRPLADHAAYRDGLFEVQDAGSQMIVDLCGAEPGMTVIDLCAGAGGKALALAAAMNNEGRILASDTVRVRLSELMPRAERAGATLIDTMLLDPGKELAMLAEMDSAADIVLVDAPCSGSGTWRRNPEARWRVNPASLAATNRAQAELLRIGAHLVRPGGSLVYAVCSVLQAEGEGQAARFLADHAGWTADLPDDAPGRSTGAGRLLTPMHDGTDGFFVARFKKAC